MDRQYVAIDFHRRRSEGRAGVYGCRTRAAELDLTSRRSPDPHVAGFKHFAPCKPKFFTTGAGVTQSLRVGRTC
jgi:hypothetical protein